jgi:hypothetical protein
MLYTERPTDGESLQVARVTLHRIPSGNAHTEKIPAAKFDLSNLVRVPASTNK